MPVNSYAPAKSDTTQELYDPSWVSRFYDKLQNPEADIRSTLVEMVREDGPDKPLPIELVLNVVPDLEPSKAREVISVAKSLGIWNETEELWLLFQQATTEAQVGAANWIQQAIPLIRQIWERSTKGSTLRSWAACWLVERGLVSKTFVLSALTEAPATKTYPGHYVRRLRLWNQCPEEIQAFLPAAVDGLADAWTLLGADRLADRAAASALLALALAGEFPQAASRLQKEVECLAAKLSQGDFERDFRPILTKLRVDLPQTKYIHTPINWDDPIAVLLRQGRTKEAVRTAETAPPAADDDTRLRRVVLTAEASRRAQSSRDALEILNRGSCLLAKASAETAWAFHCLKAIIHWSRIEYSLALLSTDDAGASAARAGDHVLLYYSTIVRQKLFYNMRLFELKDEAESVMDSLDTVLASVNVLRPDREQMGPSEWLSVDARIFGAVRDRSRGLFEFWKDGTLSGSRLLGRQPKQQFGQELHLLLEFWEGHKVVWSAEPLSFAIFNLNLANLAVSARREWPENADLLAAHLKEWVETASRIAAELQAFKLVDAIRTMLDQHANVMREYEIPRAYSSKEMAKELTLAEVNRLLSGVDRSAHRRWLLRAAHQSYGELLGSLNPAETETPEALQLLESLQELKQPSLDDYMEAAVIQKSAHTYEDIEEEVRDDDLDLRARDWRDAVGARLAEEDAICLDFFLTDGNLYCFIADASNGQFVCRIHALKLPWNTNVKKRFSTWRSNMRAIGSSITDNADASDVHIASGRLDKQLVRNPEAFPGQLEELLLNRHPKVIYIAPSLSLHGLPLHALRSRSGWSMSDLAPVLRITKTRQLAERPQKKQGPICIIAGPEKSFKMAAEQLSADLGAPVSTPHSWRDLKDNLRWNRLSVILAHGWFDKKTPSRSRISLDDGLRLTLSNIQRLGIEGAEIALLSCWAGWSVRGGLPIGEIMGGPSSWMVGGAGALLAPLWPIPISAGNRFLADYLKARQRGEPRAMAFRSAQEESNDYEFGGLCRAAYVLWGTDSE